MVRFVSVNDMARWVAHRGVEAIIAGLVAALEDDFRRWDDFDKRPRFGAQSDDGVIELMPTSDGATFGFKYVSGHPINAHRSLQTVTAFGALSDATTGYPILVAEMTVLTALRTAAVSTMFARALAPPHATTMAMIGAGAQAEFQALAFRSMLGIETVRVFDVDDAAMAKLEANAPDLGGDVVRCRDALDAITGAEIITTCTADQRNATVITDEMFEQARRAGGVTGVHINAIGGDCPGKTELDDALVRRCSIFVEYAEQTFLEGEIQALPREWPVTEFSNVLTGDAVGRRSPDELTLFDSVGFAVEDMCALRFLDESVRRTGHFAEIDLVAEPDDPKNLFSLIGAHRRAGVR
ncbi:MAG: ornithine cyclodeaminase [Ilumatobacter sp.]